jgi:hypothetical protein
MMDVNFILTGGIQDIPVPPCSQGWEFCRIKACTMADDNYGVCLEISRSFLLMSFVLHVVNGCTWINLTDMCVFMPCLYPSVDSHEVVMVSCCSRCHRYCELQTEERGPKKLAWDTACYQQGFTITGVCCARCKFLRCLEAEIRVTA